VALRIFRPPRRLRIHRAGWTVIVGALGLGLAAMATGNNLLYLILGGMLGLIALSGWLSEVTLRGVRVSRRVPRGIEAGAPVHLVYDVENAKRLLPSFALEMGEREDAARGFLAALRPGSRGSVRVERVWARRGVYRLTEVTVATSFPFGLFRKERDLEIAGEVVVWPRTGRAVRDALPAGDRNPRSGELAAGVSGARGEYRSLRGYVPGDDPRDVHWRSTARTGAPVIREYAREQARALWLCLDLRGTPAATDDAGLRGSRASGDANAGGGAEGFRARARGNGSRIERPEERAEEPPEEVAVEIVAALAARAAREGRPFGLVTADARVEEASGPRQLERVLDALARAVFRPDAPPPSPPVPASGCVLVTASAASGAPGGWGDVHAAGGPG
jgi:uncharacterized protein (DUF58 family)